MFKNIYKSGKLSAWSMMKDKLRAEHKLNYLFWECTLRCNFFCKHCGSHAGGKKFEGELTTQEIKDAFKSIAQDMDAKTIMLAITGGEPLVREDIFEVMRYASDLGFNWGMVTNGFLVTDEIAQKMKGAGMKTVVVSIDGIGKTHDDLRGVDSAYEHAVDAVKILAKAGFLKNLQITSTITKKSIDQLEEMYQKFMTLGIHSWRLFNIDPIGRALENPDLILDKQDLKRVLDFIKEKRKKTKIDITYGCAGFLGLNYEFEVRQRPFYCNTGINTGSILYNGDIYVCPNVPRIPELIQGNVRQDRFSEVWNKKFEFFRDKKRTNCEKCSKCQWWDECLGGSMHLWDFDKKEPKMCHLEMLK